MDSKTDESLTSMETKSGYAYTMDVVKSTEKGYQTIITISAIFLSPGSAWGRAALGPEATIGKNDSCPHASKALHYPPHHLFFRHISSSSVWDFMARIASTFPARGIGSRYGQAFLMAPRPALSRPPYPPQSLQNISSIPPFCTNRDIVT
ncbi:MAG: hypothetical protein ACUVQ6_08790 [Dissulfurimicrobium sp.]|uniref:hypothetical protein n=1 Tax=Dissulfurimicrobium sp. TaxID=2022436 RepID=UPI00404996B2